MSNLKEFLQFCKGYYGSILPISKIKKEVFLREVKAKVEHYKPLIEERYKVDLGEIKVKDAWYAAKDCKELYLEEAIREIEEKNNKPISKNEEKKIIKQLYGIEILARVMIYFKMTKATMFHHNSTIYVPFNFTNRVNDNLTKSRTINLDQIVVHEMMHTLWEKVAGKHYVTKGENDWNDGLAQYCTEKDLSNIYPNNYRLMHLPDYQERMRPIEILVNKYGREILREIPVRWKELSEEQPKI